MLDEELSRIVIRARKIWRRAESACSNEAAMQAHGENFLVDGNSKSPLCSFDDDYNPSNKPLDYQI